MILSFRLWNDLKKLLYNCFLVTHPANIPGNYIFYILYFIPKTKNIKCMVSPGINLYFVVAHESI